MATKPPVSEETKKTAFEFGFKIRCYEGSAIRFINRMFDPAVSAMPMCYAGNKIEEVHDHLRETAEIIDGNFFKEFYGDTETGDFDFVYSSWSGKSEVRFFDGLLEVGYTQYCGIYRTRQEYVEILQEIGGFGNLDFGNEKFPNTDEGTDTTKNISEENIASMAEATQNIANDSTAMRLGMVAIADAMLPMIKEAGIEFRHPTHSWAHHKNVGLFVYRDGYECRCLSIGRLSGEWVLAIHTENDDEGINDNILFSEASRDDLIEAIKRMPKFLIAYWEEIEFNSRRFTDLREKAEAMLKIVEG